MQYFCPKLLLPIVVLVPNSKMNHINLINYMYLVIYTLADRFCSESFFVYDDFITFNSSLTCVTLTPLLYSRSKCTTCLPLILICICIFIIHGKMSICLYSTT